MTTTIKFRAEAMDDITLAINVLGQEFRIAKLNVNRVDCLADCICTMVLENGSQPNLENIRDFLRRIRDGHVMVQTVALEADFTGKRDTNIEF